MKYFNSLQSLFPGGMISKSAAMLEEKEVNVSTAVSTIIASFLEVIRKKGNNPEMENIWKEAGNLDILSGVGHISQENVAPEQQALGDNFLEHLLGDKAAGFTDAIATKTGISKPATNRLVSMMAPVIAGFFGRQLVKEKQSMHTIFTELENQKDCSKTLVPAGIFTAFKSSGAVEHKSGTHHSKKTEKSKKGRSWIIWLLLILLLLLLLFLWRSCRDRKAHDVAILPVTAVDTTVAKKVAAEREALELTLPNGVKLNAFAGGIEDKMIRFLNSDEYKNATAKDLEGKWFVFDNIRFEFDSSEKLMGHSMVQVKNIAEILKAYKDSRIRIAGFADHVGTEQVNLAISKERAKTIEKLLDQEGVEHQVVRTDGYGEEYAKHAVTESDQARSEDRDIALRFVK